MEQVIEIINGLRGTTKSTEKTAILKENKAAAVLTALALAAALLAGCGAHSSC